MRRVRRERDNGRVPRPSRRRACAGTMRSGEYATGRETPSRSRDGRRPVRRCRERPRRARCGPGEAARASRTNRSRVSWIRAQCSAARTLIATCASEALVECRDDDAEPAGAQHGSHPIARYLIGKAVTARAGERQRRPDTSRQFTIEESITLWSRSPAVTQTVSRNPRARACRHRVLRSRTPDSRRSVPTRPV